ncbi:cytochrome P450 71D8-like [Arachis stenosperma]|uniref:cytochrome P450 71D8-like n=1 Tax=Arachis stenosperma TaxID=217475 RepID=UPI0025AC2A6C|nr:cytochrome P450 71D8-like [Arachis stenosperma]
MESESYFLLVLIIIIFLLLMLIMHVLNYNLTQKLPPGPRKLPIIGNLHQLAAAGSLPHRSFRELAKKYGPIMHLKLGENPTVVISSPELAMEILKTHDSCFLKRPRILAAESFSFGSSDIAFAPCGEMWRQLRKICTLELLSVERVRSLSRVREEESAKFIESIRESSGSAVNLKTMIFSLISASVYRSAFGKIPEDKNEIDEFISLIRKAIEMGSGFYLCDLFPSVKPLYYVTGMKFKLGRMKKKLEKIFDNIITEHQHKQVNGGGDNPKEEEDLVDVLLRLHKNSSTTHQFHITTNTIKAVIMDIFAAGTDTSASTLEWAMSEMVRNPRVMAKSQAEVREAFRGKQRIHESDVDKLSYLKSVMKETLRLHPPTPLLIPRECTERNTIGGYEIGVGTRVMVNAWAMGRDPEYWHDAEKFIPERFDGNCSIGFRGNSFEYLPFGAGRRICPGIAFGLATIMFPLALLLYHFNWELPGAIKAEDLDMTEHFGLAMERKNDLCLIPSLVM